MRPSEAMFALGVTLVSVGRASLPASHIQYGTWAVHRLGRSPSTSSGRRLALPQLNSIGSYSGQSESAESIGRLARTSRTRNGV